VVVIRFDGDSFVLKVDMMVIHSFFKWFTNIL